MPTAIETVAPDDAANQRLTDHVRPAGWRNPELPGTYDLVVLGGGTAGLVSAMGAAGLGARVALVERDRLGGDCLNTGCVPSKALIRSARVVGELSRAAQFGIVVADSRVDFPAVMQRMRDRRATIAAHDAAERLQRAGVDVFFGEGRFTDARTVAVGPQRLRFNRAVIATGGRSAAPPIPGLDRVPFYTNETVFSLAELPRRLLIIGAGPIGCELGQAFARFGSAVTILAQDPQVLPRESPDAAAVLRRHLESDGVRLELGVRVTGIDADAAGLTARFAYDQDGRGAAAVTGDAILVAAGRAPNVEGLALEAAGVRTDKHGVVVNDRLQTTNTRVFSAGDVGSEYKFTHAADAMARLVIQNALFFGRRKASALVIPWVTFTDPEVAHVGVSHHDVAESGGRLATITVPLAHVDRAIVDDEADGFVQVHHARGRLRGCTIVAPHAGEMIGLVVHALTQGDGVASFSSAVLPYPTIAEAIRKVGDDYRRQALTPGRRKWLARYFRWTR